MEILDSSYILHSDLDFSSGKFVVTNSVLSEIKEENALMSIELALKKGKVKVEEPKKEFIGKVKEQAKKTGDLEYLSNADIDILALALETQYEILTDDYRIQNVASLLKIKFRSLAQRGIRKNLHWTKICEGCSREYEKGETCSICGASLKKIAKPFKQ